MASAKGVCLVTGVSGFVGLHVAKAAAEAGYTVRGTVRSIEKYKDTLSAIVPGLELVRPMQPSPTYPLVPHLLSPQP